MAATPEQLRKEANERPRQAIVAGIAAILTIGAPIVAMIGLPHSPSNLPGLALYRNAHRAPLVISVVFSVLSLLAIAYTLDFLYRATRLRNPQLPQQIRFLPLVGAVGLAVVSGIIQVATIIQISKVVKNGALTYDDVKNATDFGALNYLGLIAQLVFALALVMISVNAMRVGLLRRFMGYLGIISAVLFVIPLVPIPIVQVYWLGALAWLFLGRAPGGDPPAWERGEAVPWPSTQELREQRVREAEARRGSAAPEPVAPAEEPARPTPNHPEPVESGSGSSAGAARRKRKKRR